MTGRIVIRLALCCLGAVLAYAGTWLAGCEGGGLNPQALQTVLVTTPLGTSASPSLQAGQSLQLAGSVTGPDGNPVYLASGSVQWSSSNPAVATVDTSGNVTAASPGTTQITAAEAGSTVTSTPITITVTAHSGPGTAPSGGQTTGSGGETLTVQ